MIFFLAKNAASNSTKFPLAVSKQSDIRIVVCQRFGFCHLKLFRIACLASGKVDANEGIDDGKDANGGGTDD